MLELQIAKNYYWTSNFEELPAFQPIVHLGQKKVTTVWITFVQKYLTLFWGFEFQTVVIWTVAAFIALIRLQLFVINQRIQTVVIKIPTAENIFGKFWTVANFYQYISSSCPYPKILPSFLVVLQITLSLKKFATKMNDWWIEMFIDGFNDNSFFETFISKHCLVNFFYQLSFLFVLQ